LSIGRGKESSDGTSLLMCTVLHGFNHSFMVILPPLYLSMQKEFGYEAIRPIMLLGSVYLVVYALSTLPFGFIGDRSNKKRILTFGVALNSAALLWASLTSSYRLLLLAMVAAGVGGGTYHPVANALMTNRFKGRMGRALGIIGVGASLGLFSGPLLSGFLGQMYGWRTACGVFGIVGLVFALFFAIFMPADESTYNSKVGKRRNLGLGRDSIRYLAMAGVVFGLRDFCWWGTQYLTPTFSQQVLDFTKFRSGLLIGLMSLMGIISQPVGGILSDRFGRRGLLAAVLIIGGAVILVFPLFSGAALFLGGMLGGAMILATVPIVDALIAEGTIYEIRSRIFAILMTAGIFMGSLSPYVMGLIVDYLGDYGLAYRTLGLASWLAALVVLFGIGKLPSRQRS